MDPILTEVIRGALAAVAEEIGTAVVRAAYSTSIKESGDVSGAIFDRRGRLVAQSATTMVSHVASLRACIASVLELYDPADDEPLGAAIVNAAKGGTYELRAWAATVDTREPAVSRRLVTAIADALRRSGGRRVVASVGDADPERLASLLDAGFRVLSVERDAPLASGGRPGDPSRDLVWMDQDL